MKKTVKLLLTALAAAMLLSAAACSNGGGSGTASTPVANPLNVSGLGGSSVPQTSVVTPSVPQTSVVTPSVPQTSVETPSVPQTSVETPSVPQVSVVSTPSTVSIPTTSTVTTPQTGSQCIGVYGVELSPEYAAMLSSLSEQEQLAVQYLLNSTMTLNEDGSLIYELAGQKVGGSWSDNKDGTVTIDISGGNKSTFNYSDGMIFNPTDNSTYFVKK